MRQHRLRRRQHRLPDAAVLPGRIDPQCVEHRRRHGGAELAVGDAREHEALQPAAIVPAGVDVVLRLGESGLQALGEEAQAVAAGAGRVDRDHALQVADRERADMGRGLRLGACGAHGCLLGVGRAAGAAQLAFASRFCPCSFSYRNAPQTAAPMAPA